MLLNFSYDGPQDYKQREKKSVVVRNKLIPHVFLFLNWEKAIESLGPLGQLYKRSSLVAQITMLKKTREPRC